MLSYAVIGASRGIGLAYVTQLAERPDTTVFAIVRKASTSTFLNAAISGLKNVHVLEADVADYPSLELAATEISSLIGSVGLDCLIHNAARMDADGLSWGFDDYPNMAALDEDFIQAYKVNTLGVIHSITAFLPLLRASTAPLKKIVVVGSPAGDYRNVRKWGDSFVGTGMAAYGVTKGGALIAATKYAMQLQHEGFVVVTLSPGFVDISDTAGDSESDITRKRAQIQRIEDAFEAASVPLRPMTPAQSVTAQLKTIDALTPEQNGAFLTETGVEFMV
ncbi:NAD-P-binding protein [Daedaleopsis nitida]|nr:NAD-P-binding protein [Daedaleopsis nitida]